MLSRIHLLTVEDVPKLETQLIVNFSPKHIRRPVPNGIKAVGREA
jgi:hypothetical protein